ncbi:hypothetical protein [Pseudomonas pergaminensis]
MDEKIAHLTFIQGVVNRMAANSFLVKGWTIALIAALLAIAADKITFAYMLVVLVPVILFWWLDSYYLMQERLYRELYKDVSQKASGSIDFNMDSSTYKGRVESFFEIARSSSVGPFYLVIVALLVVMYFRSCH